MNIQKVENLINLISTLSTEEVEFLKSQLNSNLNKNNNNIEFFCSKLLHLLWIN